MNRKKAIIQCFSLLCDVDSRWRTSGFPPVNRSISGDTREKNRVTFQQYNGNFDSIRLDLGIETSGSFLSPDIVKELTQWILVASISIILINALSLSLDLAHRSTRRTRDDKESLFNKGFSLGKKRKK